MKIKKLTPKKFNEMYAYVPRVAVDLFIETGDGVLLEKRDIPPFVDYWHLPGSHVLKGEKIEQTAKRCAGRELGLKIKLGKLKYVADDPNRDPRGHIISLVYSVKIVGGKLRGSKEGKEVRFFKRLPKKMGFDYRKILRSFEYR
jgi:8-oxo-dGTP diphosphatase